VLVVSHYLRDIPCQKIATVFWICQSYIQSTGDPFFPRYGVYIIPDMQLNDADKTTPRDAALNPHIIFPVHENLFCRDCKMLLCVLMSLNFCLYIIQCLLTSSKISRHLNHWMFLFKSALWTPCCDLLLRDLFKKPTLL